MDVDHLSIAEIWRQASIVAGEHGLYRPGYHAVLAIVRDERSRRALRRDAACVLARDAKEDFVVNHHKVLASARLSS